jgi:hypothetical protein
MQKEAGMRINSVWLFLAWPLIWFGVTTVFWSKYNTFETLPKWLLSTVSSVLMIFIFLVAFNITTDYRGNILMLTAVLLWHIPIYQPQIMFLRRLPANRRNWRPFIENTVSMICIIVAILRLENMSM